MASIDLDSVELRTFTVSTVDGQDIHADSVQVAFIAEGFRPDPAVDWHTASYISAAGTVYTFQVGFNTSGGVSLATLGGVGTYEVWVKVTDNPEVPILKTGDSLTVTT